jgi:hypothetical protein
MDRLRHTMIEIETSRQTDKDKDKVSTYQMYIMIQVVGAFNIAF